MVIRYAPASPPPAPLRGPVAFRGDAVLPLSIRLVETLERIRAHLRRRALPMALASAVPLAGLGLFVALKTPVYQTAAAVFVDPQAARPARADGSTDAAVLAGQLRLATSRTVLQKALEQGKLAEEAGIKGADGWLARLFQIGLKLAGIQSGGGQNQSVALVQGLSSAVQAKLGDGVNLIEISGTAPDATAAARIANAVAQAFVDEIVASTDAASGSERSRLTRRGDDLKVRLQEAESRLMQFRARNGLDTKAPSTEAGAASELVRARAAAAEAKARYEQLQKLMANGKEPEVIADLVQSPSIERLKAQYNDAAAQEISFRSSLGPRHPAYLEVQQQAREKKRLLQEGLRLAQTAARIEWQSAREQEMAAEKRAGSEPAAPAAATQAPMPTQLRELERDVEMARAAYDRYIRSLDTPDPAAQGMAARVVSQAAAPLAPLSRIGGGAIASTLGMSLLFAAIAGLRTGRRRSRTVPEAPSRALRRAVSTSRPPMAPEPQTPAPVVIRHRPAAAPAEAPAYAPEPAQTPAPQGPALETIEALASDLVLASGAFTLQTVLCASLAPQAGKSEAALALARAAQRQHLRVLVIDADEGEDGLSTRCAGSPVAGTIPIQGRLRPLLAVGAGPQRFCVIPVEARAPALPDLATLPALDGIVGHFDLVIVNGPILQGTLLERKLARAAQVVMLPCAPGAMPEPGRASLLLGVSAAMLRFVTAPDAAGMASDGAPAASRPMSVVRLRNVA